MRMNDSQMYARVLNSDATCNGRFFFGVTSTGIYCLPSCRARKPGVKNVRFFPTAEAARTAGFRACKKCHPDDFARGADPVLETIESLVSEIRAQPAAFADARAIVRRSGFGATRVFELFRQHYHAAPADVLLRARLAAAKRQLLATQDGLARIASDAGFESLSVFHERFRRLNGITPAGYRQLPHSASFELSLPSDYATNYLRRAFSRDPQSVTERLTGDRYVTAVRLPDGSPGRLTLDLIGHSIRVTRHNVAGQKASSIDVHTLVTGLLGLDQDTSGFSRLARRLGIARLVAGREGLHICQTPSVFDGILWAIIGQQINLAFASVLRRRLIELTGTPVGEDLLAPPTPARVASLEPADLLPLQFSRQKAAYVVATARLITTGQLDLATLGSMSATRAERTLLAVHGLGPWSVNYLMMRSLGFADCVPYGDTGVTSGLKTLFRLEERPDVDATRRLMSVFAPARSLATAHLWQLNQPPPS